MNYLKIISIVIIFTSLGAVGVDYVTKSEAPVRDGVVDGKQESLKGEVTEVAKASTSSEPSSPIANTSSIVTPIALSSWASYLSTSGNYTSSPWAGTVRNRISETEPADVLLHANILMVESQGLESARQQSEVDAYMKALLADNGTLW